MEVKLCFPQRIFSSSWSQSPRGRCWWWWCPTSLTWPVDISSSSLEARFNQTDFYPTLATWVFNLEDIFFTATSLMITYWALSVSVSGFWIFLSFPSVFLLILFFPIWCLSHPVGCTPPSANSSSCTARSKQSVWLWHSTLFVFDNLIILCYYFQCLIFPILRYRLCYMATKKVKETTDIKT